jgi:hypothetical protein
LAHFKKRTVKKELQNSNWIQAVRRIATREELLQFVDLWSMLRNITLNPRVKDEIKWKWMPNSEYSVASMYKIQFQGSHVACQVGRLWKARGEPKVKVFV